MYMEHDLGLWVWIEYGRRFAEREKRKKIAKPGKPRFRREVDSQAKRYLEDRDIFNFPA
jgi:hypothetical protein